MWADGWGGSSIDHTSRNVFFLRFVVRIGVWTPLVLQVSRLQYILRFGRFDVRYDPGIRGRGEWVSSKRTMLDKGVGRPKSQFLLRRL